MARALSLLALGLVVALGSATPVPAGLPCCDDRALVGGTAAPDGGICLPGHPDFEPADEDTADTAEEPNKEEDKDWFVDRHRGPSHPLSFTTETVTFANVDVSPDGTTLVFDCLGDLYTLPITGGTATRLTSGVAYDHQPRFSPDGASILFTTDRSGSENVWVMAADGTGIRPITSEGDKNMNSADWLPDGEYVVARKRLTNASPIGQTELWLYHQLGGSGVKLTDKDDLRDVSGPVASPDGRWIYFAYRPGGFRYNQNVYGTIWQIRALDRETGRVRVVADGFGGSGRPALSPDGNTLAFIRRDRTNTVLMLQDLAAGTERELFDGLDPDLQENFVWTGIYSGYSWTPDGKAIVIFFDGKPHRIDVATGEVTAIPMSVPVEQEVADVVRFHRDIAPDDVHVKMISWPTISPDGNTLLFSALGSLYSMDLPDGAPRRLETEGARAYCPTWSADGKRIAYVSWSDDGEGHVWTASPRGGSARRITTESGQYSNPAFSRDGSKLVWVSGVGVTKRGQGLGDEHHMEIHWAPVSGGAPAYVVTVDSRGSSRRVTRPRWNADGTRIWYLEDVGPWRTSKAHLRSIRPDGTDLVDHLKIQYAEEIVPSPDGKWALYSRLFEGYLIALPEDGRQAIELSGEGGPVPGWQFAREGANWLDWSSDGKTVTWSYGPEVYRASLEDVRREWLESKLKAGEKTIPKDEDEAPADTTGGGDDSGDDEDEDKPFTVAPDTLAVDLTVPRAKPTGTWALTGARLVTMDGYEVIENGTLVVRDDTIAEVGPADAVTIPDGATVIDGTGRTVIPGMVDAHAHLHYQHMEVIPEAVNSYYANLAYGVTTVHDPSADTYSVFTQAEMVEAGVTTGPRVFSTGFILYGADIANRALTNSLDDARRHVRRMKKVGAISVKSYMQPRREQRQWILQAAREESVLVVPEGGGKMEENMGMVIDGHTGIEHSLPVAPIYDDVVQLFARTKAGYTPTLLVSYGGLSGEHWFYQRYNLWENEKLLRFMPRGPIDARSRRREVMAPDDDWHHFDIAAGCAGIVEAGGIVNLGGHGQVQGVGPHWELWALTQGGMSNHDALRCATILGATYLGLDGNIGSLEAGKLADFVVLDRNPLDEIQNSDSVHWVAKNGELFEGDTMDRVLPSPAPCPVFYWQRTGTE